MSRSMQNGAGAGAGAGAGGKPPYSMPKVPKASRPSQPSEKTPQELIALAKADIDEGWLPISPLNWLTALLSLLSVVALANVVVGFLSLSIGASSLLALGLIGLAMSAWMASTSLVVWKKVANMQQALDDVKTNFNNDDFNLAWGLGLVKCALPGLLVSGVGVGLYAGLVAGNLALNGLPMLLGVAVLLAIVNLVVSESMVSVLKHRCQQLDVQLAPAAKLTVEQQRQDYHSELKAYQQRVAGLDAIDAACSQIVSCLNQQYVKHCDLQAPIALGLRKVGKVNAVLGHVFSALFGESDVARVVDAASWKNIKAQIVNKRVKPAQLTLWIICQLRRSLAIDAQLGCFDSEKVGTLIEGYERTSRDSDTDAVVACEQQVKALLLPILGARALLQVYRFNTF